MESDEVCGPRLKKFERNDGHDLEESCILVEGDDLHYPVQGTRKHKSYKVHYLSLSLSLSHIHGPWLLSEERYVYYRKG